MITALSMLSATPVMDDPVFSNTTIFIIQSDSSGTIGFILNKTFTRKLNELVEFSDALPFVLYEGGPVQNTQLFFIHQRPDLIEEGEAIGSGLYVGGNFAQAVNAINNKIISDIDIRIFIGYCGWDAGELEMEVEEGSWKIDEKIVSLKDL